MGRACKHNCVAGLGLMQILGGLGMIALGILNIIYASWAATFLNGLWGGFWFVASGVVGLCGGCCRSKGMNVAFMMLSMFFNIVIAGGVFIISLCAYFNDNQYQVDPNWSVAGAFLGLWRPNRPPALQAQMQYGMGYNAYPQQQQQYPQQQLYPQQQPQLYPQQQFNPYAPTTPYNPYLQQQPGIYPQQQPGLYQQQQQPGLYPQQSYIGGMDPCAQFGLQQPFGQQQFGNPLYPNQGQQFYPTTPNPFYWLATTLNPYFAQQPGQFNQQYNQPYIFGVSTMPPNYMRCPNPNAAIFNQALMALAGFEALLSLISAFLGCCAACANQADVSPESGMGGGGGRFPKPMAAPVRAPPPPQVQQAPPPPQPPPQTRPPPPPTNPTFNQHPPAPAPIPPPAARPVVQQQPPPPRTPQAPPQPPAPPAPPAPQPPPPQAMSNGPPAAPAPSQPPPAAQQPPPTAQSRVGSLASRLLPPLRKPTAPAAATPPAESINGTS